MSRKERITKKHERIRLLFKKRYTDQRLIRGAKRYTKEYIVAGLAEEFYLSMRQIENIIYSTPKPAAGSDAPAAALAA